jgi:Peptidase family M48
VRAVACIGLIAGLSVSTAAIGQETQRQPTVALTTAQAEGLIREVSATVEQLRHLRFKTPVAVQVVDGATARKDFEADIDDAEREQARHTRDAWVQLGLVPPATDLVAAQLDLAEKGVLGYYHSGSKTFRLLSHVSESEVRSVMAHELTHALEDQHYDLAAVQKRASNEDQAVAIRAVIEGSAMVSTLGMLRRQGGIGKAKQEATRSGESRAKTVEGAPTFVQMRLLLPYTLGFSFLLRGKPWEFLFDGVRMQDIEQAYTQPPYSTREILHPEEYWGGHRDAARPLEMPDLSSVLGPGWKRAVASSIGELGLTVITGSHVKTGAFEALLPTRWTTAGATGNAGDVYHHYVNGERKVTVSLTRWETLRDGDEFLRTLRMPSRTIYRVGANVVILVGDFGDKGQTLAGEAARGLKFWAD